MRILNPEQVNHPVTSRKKSGNFRWEVNWKYLEEVVLPTLGIEWQVKRITRTSSIRHSGVHRTKIKNGKPCHYIAIDKFADKESAVKILLHELRHAWQNEQFRKLNPDCSWRDFFYHWKYSSWRAGPYRDRKIEVDARKAEERYTEFLDLVREL